MKKNIYWVIIISLIGSGIFGFQQFSKKEKLKQELNLDGLFVNVKDIKIDTKESSIFDKKPYENITIKIPSLASENDDSLIDGKKVNKIIDREKFDEKFTLWLKHIFRKDVARKYTNNITIWYRDQKIVNETYKK